jgi:urease accessory protein
LRLDASQMLLLLNWMSPVFPIGSFAYSHGLETVIADGGIKTAQELEQWITDVITRGSGWSDAVIFNQCFSDASGDLNELALALCPSAERHQETTQLGRNFLVASAVWTAAALPHHEVAYPVAAGRACHALGIPRDAAVMAYLQGFCSALVSVAVRLVPLGQTKGLEVMRDLAPVISDVAARATTATPAGLGTSCIAADIAAMRHETLEPRVFRT